MENKIAKELIESFGYEHQLTELSASDIWDATKSIAGSDEVKSMAKTAGAGAVAGKVASKILGRAIPGAGTALSWKDAYDRWQAGDRSGAVMSALAGAAYLFSGPGTAIGLGLDAANWATDDDDEDTEEKPETPVNKLTQLQQIIGAKPDGIYGPETKEKLMAWQKEQGIKVDGIPGPETYTTAGLAESKGIIMKKTTTVAEDIATLRDKLLIIETQELDEGWWDVVKAAGTGAKKYASSGFSKIKLPGGVKNVEKAMSALGPEQLKKLSQSALKNPQLKYSEKYAIQKMGLLNWLKANPGKASLISGIAGVLGYSLGSNDSEISTSHPTRPTTGGKQGDSEVMDRQQMLNDLGANIKVDGIWGPETEKAYQEYWVNNFAKHNALATGVSPEEAEKRQANWNAASQMGKPVAQSELDKKTADLTAAAQVAAEKAKKDQEEYDAKKQQSVAESIATLRDLLTSIENK